MKLSKVFLQLGECMVGEGKIFWITNIKTHFSQEIVYKILVLTMTYLDHVELLVHEKTIIIQVFDQFIKSINNQVLYDQFK